MYLLIRLGAAFPLKRSVLASTANAPPRLSVRIFWACHLASLMLLFRASAISQRGLAELRLVAPSEAIQALLRLHPTLEWFTGKHVALTECPKVTNSLSVV